MDESWFFMSFRCVCIFHECYLESEQDEIRAGVILSLHLPFSVECVLLTWYMLKDNLDFPFRRNFWAFAFLCKDSFKYLTSVNRGRMAIKTERNVPPGSACKHFSPKYILHHKGGISCILKEIVFGNLRLFV